MTQQLFRKSATDEAIDRAEVSAEIVTALVAAEFALESARRHFEHVRRLAGDAGKLSVYSDVGDLLHECEKLHLNARLLRLCLRSGA